MVTLAIRDDLAPAQDGFDRRGEPAPIGALPVQRRQAGGSDAVRAARTALLLRPGAGDQADPLQTLERRIDGALGQVELAGAPLAEGLDDRVAVRRTGREDGQDQAVEVPSDQLLLHAKTVYA